MSFTCGNPGTKGGIGLQIGQPADQEVFIGVIDGDRYADAPLQSLPFYVGAVSKAAEAFTVEQAGPSEANVRPDAVPFKLDGDRAALRLVHRQLARRGHELHGLHALRLDPRSEEGEHSEDARRAAACRRGAARRRQHQGQEAQDRHLRAQPLAARPADDHGRPGTEEPRRLRVPPRGGRRRRGVRPHVAEEGRGAAAVRLHALVGDRRHPGARQPGAPAGIVPGCRLRGAAWQALRHGAGHRLVSRMPGDHGARRALPLHPLLRGSDGRPALDARQGRRADGRRGSAGREARRGAVVRRPALHDRARHAQLLRLDTAARDRQASPSGS